MTSPHEEDEIRQAINATTREVRELKQGFRREMLPGDRANNAKIAIKLRSKQAYIKQLQGRLTGAVRK